jgi:hypothetical protein
MDPVVIKIINNAIKVGYSGKLLGNTQSGAATASPPACKLDVKPIVRKGPLAGRLRDAQCK